MSGLSNKHAGQVLADKARERIAKREQENVLDNSDSPEARERHAARASENARDSKLIAQMLGEPEALPAGVQALAAQVLTMPPAQAGKAIAAAIKALQALPPGQRMAVTLNIESP